MRRTTRGIRQASEHRATGRRPRPLHRHVAGGATPVGQRADRSGPPLWFRQLLTRRAGRTLVTFLAAVAGLAMIVGVSGVRVASQQVGTVGVVRNGGPFDNRAIRQVLLPGQRLTWIGWYSQSPHVYPASN